MGAKFAVEELSEEQFEFVIRAINNGATDREISRQFETEFGEPLAKSSLNRWRKAAGNELAERYRFARFQAKQLLEDLEHDPEADKYKIIMQSVEDRLLTATHSVISQDPFKLLQIRQEEEKLKLREQEIELKKQQLELEREKLRGAAMDKIKLGAEFAQDLLEYIGTDVDGIRFLTRHLQPFNEFLKAKHGAAQN